MTAQKLVRQKKLQEWARMIEECENSGKTVSDWCEANGVGYKNYFYRKRRVREKLLDMAETALTLRNSVLPHSETPVFAQVAMPKKIREGSVAATIRIGMYTAEITNGADLETVDGLLRSMSRI